MNKKIAVLCSPESWFKTYAENLVEQFSKKGFQCSLFFDHEDISEEFEIVFILSYFKIIPEQYMKCHKHNIVVHESDLPSGRGWAPLFWQILEGKNRIPLVLFEATNKVDEGPIYLKDYIELDGFELHHEIRKKQAQKTMEMCIRFIDDYDSLKPVPQTGVPTEYRKRNSSDSELDPDTTIRKQFNLLRIVNNEEFPAFFNFKGEKYILKIYRAEE